MRTTENAIQRNTNAINVLGRRDQEGIVVLRVSGVLKDVRDHAGRRDARETLGNRVQGDAKEKRDCKVQGGVLVLKDCKERKDARATREIKDNVETRDQLVTKDAKEIKETRDCKEIGVQLVL